MSFSKSTWKPECAAWGLFCYGCLSQQNSVITSYLAQIWGGKWHSAELCRKRPAWILLLRTTSPKWCNHGFPPWQQPIRSAHSGFLHVLLVSPTAKTHITWCSVPSVRSQPVFRDQWSWNNTTPRQKPTQLSPSLQHDHGRYSNCTDAIFAVRRTNRIWNTWCEF